MDNITTLTLALRERRNRFPDPTLRLYHRQNSHSRKRLRETAFQRWCDGLNRPQYYIFYRISGIRQYTVGKIQTRINFMPCLVFAGEDEAYELLPDPFVFYVYIDKAKPKTGDWVLLQATTASYSTKKFFLVPPNRYHLEAREIYQHIVLPFFHESRHPGSVNPLSSMAQECFHRFQFLYRLSANHNQRYGVIDHAWNFFGKELPLNPPPQYDAFRDTIIFTPSASPFL